MVNIVEISYDIWSNNACHCQSIGAPTLEEVVDSISRLDAKHYTLATIKLSSGDEMTVGGGDSGRYVVYIESSGRFFSLCGDDRSENIYYINIGGQVGDYNVAFVVNLPQALQAATAFYRTGSADQAMQWQNQ